MFAGEQPSKHFTLKSDTPKFVYNLINGRMDINVATKERKMTELRLISYTKGDEKYFLYCDADLEDFKALFWKLIDHKWKVEAMTEGEYWEANEVHNGKNCVTIKGRRELAYYIGVFQF